MIHVLLVPVDGIVPAGSGAHHVGVGNGVFLCVAAVPFHGPVDVSRTVIIALEGQLDPVQVSRPGASGFLQDVWSAWMRHSMEYSGSVIVPGPLGNRVLYPLSEA